MRFSRLAIRSAYFIIGVGIVMDMFLVLRMVVVTFNTIICYSPPRHCRRSVIRQNLNRRVICSDLAPPD